MVGMPCKTCVGGGGGGQFYLLLFFSGVGSEQKGIKIMINWGKGYLNHYDQSSSRVIIHGKGIKVKMQ